MNQKFDLTESPHLSAVWMCEYSEWAISDLILNKVKINFKVLHFGTMYYVLANVHDPKVIINYHRRSRATHDNH